MALDERFLMAIDHAVDPQDQAEVIAIVRREGVPIRGLHPTAHGGVYWTWRGLAEPDPSILPEAGRRWLAEQKDPAISLSRWGYYARLDPDVPWVWTDSLAVPIVRRILDPVLHLYERLTKVNVILQVPGTTVPPHRDLVPGNAYALADPLHWAEGPTVRRYEGATWLDRVRPIRSASHAKNRYFSLKIPLSERADDAGSAFAQRDGKRHTYGSNHRLFFLNEVEILHGAAPVAFWRGVVFVNGILDVGAIDRAPKAPMAWGPVTDVPRA